ncbi:hypothetical protein GCM10008179_19350 [Hansschlegelia plantiphila]|uniref:GSCFA domain-containing protein n=1 Tax=Hansschlegelia plantiphila TaxID=374655 RepID=A0A9W6J071_9HYPH|nr:hypothetical protein GCM10008179_19350 [Hansschlegelia plantiphila]
MPSRSYWRLGVTEQHPTAPVDLYRKKFAIKPSDQIATAGSCFAQHIAKHLRLHNYQVIDKEPKPLGLAEAEASKYGYGLYSARYGNLYTTRQLLQLTLEAFGEFEPANVVWTKKDRFFDALRPSVEPNGLASEREVALHRASHLRHVADMLTSADIIIFTLGLTETWEHVASGTVYPTAPGVIAGRHDPETVRFRNLTHSECLSDFLKFREAVKQRNPRVKFLLTVSPVPLTATAGGEHVLAATLYSKSVLRGVAGELAQTCADIDYFPSYEIIASHPARGFFYEGNLRSVAAAGVSVVMKTFFEQHALAAPKAEARSSKPAPSPATAAPPKKHEELVCEEAMLEAFAQ